VLNRPRCPILTLIALFKSIYSKAVKAEFSKDFDSAFRLYIQAAESFLHLSRSIGRENEKPKWKSSAGKALERAEKIKAFVEKSKTASSDSSRSEARLTPVGVDYFSPRRSRQKSSRRLLTAFRGTILRREKGRNCKRALVPVVGGTVLF
jgi:hypothetical protein